MDINNDQIKFSFDERLKMSTVVIDDVILSLKSGTLEDDENSVVNTLFNTILFDEEIRKFANEYLKVIIANIEKSDAEVNSTAKVIEALKSADKDMDASLFSADIEKLKNITVRPLGTDAPAIADTNQER